MLFRFTLTNDIEGSHVISDPDGWKEIKLKLERDKEFHSLVEIVELPLIFYRSSDLVDGGYDYITNVEQTQGIDALIEILIEVSTDQGTTYETFFEGLLELETVKDISDAVFYKLECNIVRNDFWTKFMNRKSQQVNLNAEESLDGDSISEVLDINIALPSQKMRSLLDAYLQTTPFGFQIWTSSQYVQLDVDTYNLNEIETKYNIPIGRTSNLISLIDIKYSGTYVFDISFDCSLVPDTPTPNEAKIVQSGIVDLYLQVNDLAGNLFTRTEFIEAASNQGFSRFTLTKTLTLNVGDSVKLYGDFLTSETIYEFVTWGFTDYAAGDGTFIPPWPNSIGSYIKCTADTHYVSSQTDAFLLRDAAESILSKIISRNNVMFSNYLGDETPAACAANFAIMKGLHVRGYSMFDKPMFMSFDDWWEGANPIFNLGLGYETIAGTEYIRIEDKAHFYNDDPIMTFSNVEKITRVYDKEQIFKSIEIGYQRWAAESSSGVDDPQTKHSYNTRFKLIGKDLKLLSKFIAASLAIEQTRRNRVEFGKDWRLDDETIIIALNNDSSPISPELDENFSSITNLLNPETRYNIRLTPARNFERWKEFFNGCLQAYINSTPCEYYKFSSGEGNYDTETTGDGSCDTGTLAENQDICVTDDYYFTPVSYEFEYPLSFEDYKTLRDNRKNAILVSNSTTGHKTCFIQELEYDHFNAMGKFIVWIKDLDFNFE